MNYPSPRTVDRSKRFAVALARGVLLFCIAVIILYPLLYMLVLALRPTDQIWDPTVVWISKSLTLENILLTIDTIDYWDALMTSARITLIPSVLTVISCALAGYGFARFRFKCREFLFICVIFTILVPAQTVIFPSFISFWQFDFFGLGYLAAPFNEGIPFTVNLLDNELTLYLPAAFGSGIRSGLAIYIFRQFYRGLPKEMEEAARIDGCGALKTFIRIAIPASAVTMMTVFLFSMVWYWNDYYFTTMYMNNVNTVPTAVAALPALMRSLSSIGGDFKFDSVQISAMIQSGCLLLVLPPTIIFAFLQRHFIQGLELSGLVE